MQLQAPDINLDAFDQRSTAGVAFWKLLRCTAHGKMGRRTWSQRHMKVTDTYIDRLVVAPLHVDELITKRSTFATETGQGKETLNAWVTVYSSWSLMRQCMSGIQVWLSGLHLPKRILSLPSRFVQIRHSLWFVGVWKICPSLCRLWKVRCSLVLSNVERLLTWSMSTCPMSVPRFQRLCPRLEALQGRQNVACQMAAQSAWSSRRRMHQVLF